MALGPASLSLALSFRAAVRRPPLGLVFGNIFAGVGPLGACAAKRGWKVCRYEAYQDGVFSSAGEDLLDRNVVRQRPDRPWGDESREVEVADNGVVRLCLSIL